MIKWKVASTLKKARTALLFYTSGFHTLNSSLWLLWLQRRKYTGIQIELFSLKSNMSFDLKLWRFLFVLGFQTFNYDVSWHVFGIFLLEVHSTSWICRHGGLANAPHPKNIYVKPWGTSQQCLDLKMDRQVKQHDWPRETWKKCLT